MRNTPFLAIFFLIACSSTVPTSAQTVTKSPGGHFEFHTDPWISLHHFAYHYVRMQERDLILRGRVRIAEDDLSSLSEEFRRSCADLRPAYRPYIEGSLLFDPAVRVLAESLVDGVDAVPDDAVRKALVTCMPVYRDVLWPSHMAANEDTLKHLIGELERHEAAMAERFAAVLGGHWPDSPIRVDLTPYANWAGAYTDDSPPGITMSSYDAEVSGPYSLEILFHESGHTVSFENSLHTAANAALDATGLESDRFWHFVLFFAAGRVTAEVTGNPDYVPYSDATGLTRRESSAPYYDALKETWEAAGSLAERALLAARHVAADN